MIGVARAFKRLYLMQDNQDEQDFSKYCFKSLVKFRQVFIVNACKTKYKSFDQWHFRLGHVRLERINVINQQFLDIKFTNDLFCEVCLLAKQRKLSFSIHVQSFENAFELMHVDIWGPYETPTLSSQRYILTI